VRSPPWSSSSDPRGSRGRVGFVRIPRIRSDMNREDGGPHSRVWAARRVECVPIQSAQGSSASLSSSASSAASGAGSSRISSGVSGAARATRSDSRTSEHRFGRVSGPHRRQRIPLWLPRSGGQRIGAAPLSRLPGPARPVGRVGSEHACGARSRSPQVVAILALSLLNCRPMQWPVCRSSAFADEHGVCVRELENRQSRG
jgi:hypothetical protein